MAEAYLPWTEARTEYAKTHYLAGESATEIAVALGGGLTRNAVIGKLARLGVQRGRRAANVTSTAAANRQARRVYDPAQGRHLGTPAPPPPRQPLPADDDTAGAVPMAELRAHMCKWPLGNPRDPAFGFCGLRMGARLPYCDAHAERAYNPRPAPDAKAMARALGRKLAA